MYVCFSFGSDPSLTKQRWQFDDEAMNHVHRSPGRHVFARDQPRVRQWNTSEFLVNLVFNKNAFQ